MKEITRVNHIGLRVFDLATTREFYEKLGFKFIVGPVGPEPIAVMEHPSGVDLNLILNAKEKTDTNQLMDVPTKYAGYTHVALEVTDIHSVKSQLDEQAIVITEGPVEFPTGFSLFIRDPDKNVVEFHQPKKNHNW